MAAGCIVSGLSAGYYIKMTRQEMTITVTPSIQATLTEVADLYAVKLTFNSFPTGVSFASSCYATTVATTTSNIYPDYTSCIARKTAAKETTFFITKISDEDGVNVKFAAS
jgi:hypothetical protein